MAQAAEAAGFDAFFRSDHFLTMGGDGLPGPTDSWITLGAIARETDRIRLGTLVTSATFRPPGLLAIQVAQVDAMSGGRVELGLGAGWYDAEHTAYGFPFPPLGERFERLEEQYAILTGLWGTPVGETFSFDGRHYHVQDSPAPAQARPAAPSAAHRGGRWRPADASPRRHLRGRVQPPLLLGRRHERPIRPGACRLWGQGSRPGDAAAFGGPDRVLRCRRNGSAAPRRQHRPQCRRAARARRRGHAGRGGGATAGVRRDRRRRRCTSRCSTSTTSITSSCCPRKCYRRSPDRTAAVSGASGPPARGRPGQPAAAPAWRTPPPSSVLWDRPDQQSRSGRARHGAAPTGGRHDHHEPGSCGTNR